MKWEFNGHDELFEYININNKKYLELTPKEYSKTYFLIHGYGSSFYDLLPIAYELYSQNKKVVIVILDGHKGLIEIEKMNLDYWQNTVIDIINNEALRASENYVIGFSLGAMISVTNSTKYKADGIVGISTFAGVKPLSPLDLLFKFLTMERNIYFKRNLHIKNDEFKQELVYIDKTDISNFSGLNSSGIKAINELTFNKTKTLFIHDPFDVVASFKMLKKRLISKTKTYKIVKVPFKKHFLQYGVDVKILTEIITNFCENDILNNSLVKKLNKETYKCKNEEITEEVLKILKV